MGETSTGKSMKQVEGRDSTVQMLKIKNNNNNKAYTDLKKKKS